MKKIILKTTAAIAFVMLLTFNITTLQNTANFSLGGIKAEAAPIEIAREPVTCYSTYSPCSFWCWSIYRCGTCASVSADDWSDPGGCDVATT